MAFNNVGDLWLAPGQQIRLELKFGQIDGEPEWGGHDHGAQWIMAHPIGINPAELLVKDHTKQNKPRRGRPGEEAIVVYLVTVVNLGNEDAHFSLQGGGCV
jgi:hypothetical protein